MKDPDELLGYMWLKPHVTGLAIDVFVDDGRTYAMHGYEPLIYVRNGYGREVNEFIPFSIKDDQQILDATIDIKLTNEVLTDVQSFIRQNAETLMGFADDEMDVNEFHERLVPLQKPQTDMRVDEYGGVYTNDGKRLLKCPDVKRYQIAEGCEEVDEQAFEGCTVLESLYVPYTFVDEAFDRVMDFMPDSVGNICHWDRPYVDEMYDVNEYWYDEEKTTTDKQGVVYANEGRRLIDARRPGLIGKEYFVPDGVLTICDGAFSYCDYVVVSLPRSIKSIGDYIFGQEGGRFEIRD